MAVGNLRKRCLVRGILPPGALFGLGVQAEFLKEDVSNLLGGGYV